MKKKVLSVLLAVTMTASVLGGCGSSNSSQTTTDSTASGKTESGTSGTETTGEKVKLKALIISHPLTKDVTDMKWLQEIEEQANESAVKNRA